MLRAMLTQKAGPSDPASSGAGMMQQKTGADGDKPARGSSRGISWSELFTPKLVTALRDGYTSTKLRHDAIAGLTVAILALPLSMAIAIGSGVDPGIGLITSVVAGFFISALGGSRFQIGGPAAAFIVIVAAIIQKHGFDGLQTATFIAGFILLAAGFMKLGSYVRYVPGPVIMGFTTGIGAIIAISQIKDFLGLTGKVPGEVIEKIHAMWELRHTFNPSAFAIGLATLVAIEVFKRWKPRWPGLLIAIVAASAAAWALHLPVDTVGTRFGGIPQSLPSPHLPSLSWAKVAEVLPTSFTLAFLIGVESLLSAVAADAMTGARHRSNMEIVAQGAANIASPLFGGLPATGVIARTGTNIQAGAWTPVSGILHAVFVLIAMLLLAPLASYLALPCLAAVLLSVSWRLLDLGEISHFLRRAPTDDRLVLVATLLLTVFVDLNVAIGVGVTMAALLFMHRMAESHHVSLGLEPIDADDIEAIGPNPMQANEHIGRVTFRGPLFFGGTARLSATLREVPTWPRALILHMAEVPLIDATAIAALEELADEGKKHDCRVIVDSLAPEPLAALKRYGFLEQHGIILAGDEAEALSKARDIVAAARVK